MPPAFNHPARVAERIATLDLVSGGRVEWGTGESSSRLELEGFRVPYIEKRAMWAEAAALDPGEDPALISFRNEALRSPGVIERTRRVMATATAP